MQEIQKESRHGGTLVCWVLMFDRAALTQGITLRVGVVRLYARSADANADLVATSWPGTVHKSLPFIDSDGR